LYDEASDAQHADIVYNQRREEGFSIRNCCKLYGETRDSMDDNIVNIDIVCCLSYVVFVNVAKSGPTYIGLPQCYIK